MKKHIDDIVERYGHGYLMRSNGNENSTNSKGMESTVGYSGKSKKLDTPYFDETANIRPHEFTLGEKSGGEKSIQIEGKEVSEFETIKTGVSRKIKDKIMKGWE